MGGVLIRGTGIGPAVAACGGGAPRPGLVTFRRGRDQLDKGTGSERPAAVSYRKRTTMNNIIELTAENFQAEVTDSEDPVLVDLYADWCAPCRMMARVLAQVAPRYAGRVKFAKINTDEQPALAAAFRVSSIPMLALVRGREVVDVQVGLMSPEQLDRMLGAVAPEPQPR